MQCHHSTVTLPSQHCHSTIIAPSQHHRSAVTALSQHYHESITAASQQRHWSIKAASQKHYWSITEASQQHRSSCSFNLINGFFPENAKIRGSRKWKNSWSDWNKWCFDPIFAVMSRLKKICWEKWALTNEIPDEDPDCSRSKWAAGNPTVMNPKHWRLNPLWIMTKKAQELRSNVNISFCWRGGKSEKERWVKTK